MKLELMTERLLLRPLAECDLDLAIAILTNSAVMKHVGETCTVDQVIEEHPIAMRRCAGGCIGIWCVIDRSTGEKLGTTFLLPLPIEEQDTNWDLVAGDKLPNCEVEIGYILKNSAWGNGYATEATERLLRFAFEETQLEEIVAIIDAENISSQRVLEKCGFVYEGLRRAYAEECPGFRVTRQTWPERNQKTS